MSGIKKLAMFGGSGAGVGAATSLATGAKAVGLLGGMCAGSAALPVFIVVGTVSGLALLGIRTAFKKKPY